MRAHDRDTTQLAYSDSMLHKTATKSITGCVSISNKHLVHVQASANDLANAGCANSLYTVPKAAVAGWSNNLVACCRCSVSTGHISLQLCFHFCLFCCAASLHDACKTSAPQACAAASAWRSFCPSVAAASNGCGHGSWLRSRSSYLVTSLFTSFFKLLQPCARSKSALTAALGSAGGGAARLGAQCALHERFPSTGQHRVPKPGFASAAGRGKHDDDGSRRHERRICR